MKMTKIKTTKNNPVIYNELIYKLSIKEFKKLICIFSCTFNFFNFKGFVQRN